LTNQQVGRRPPGGVFGKAHSAGRCLDGSMSQIACLRQPDLLVIGLHALPSRAGGIYGVLGGQVHLLEERGVARVAFDALQKRVAFKLRETAVA
jgi:hypothetical protein